MNVQLNKLTITLDIGDIFSKVVDGIVISATRQLLPETDNEFDHRLIELAGQSLLAELEAHAPAEYGDVIITTGGNLPIKHLFHAVGPVMGIGGERGKLASTIWHALREVNRTGIRSVAFMPISTGRFGYPVESCAGVMAQKIADFTFEDLLYLKEIAIVVENADIYAIFEGALRHEIEIAQDEARTGS